MKKNIIRTGALALMLGAAAVMPGIALSTSLLAVPTGYQPTMNHGTQTPLSECERINHQNFCYCTGACGH